MLEEVLGGSHFEVVGQCGNGRDAVQEIAELYPDVILTDISLPGSNGAEMLRQLNQTIGEYRALVYSQELTPSLVKEIIREGAQGFVERSQELTELREALKIVSDGGSFLVQASRKCCDHLELGANPRLVFLR